MRFSFNRFLRGFGRVLDIGAVTTSPEVENILNKTDFEAIKSDWEIVGEDMRKAMIIPAEYLKTDDRGNMSSSKGCSHSCCECSYLKQCGGRLKEIK